MLAFHWTQESLLGNSDELRVGEGKFQSLKQGTLADALINGEVTQEVKELRWRLYKVIQHADKLTSKITGYTEDGDPIVETSMSSNSKHKLNKYKCDDSDDEFPLKMVIPNHVINVSTVDALDNLSDAGDIKKDDYLGAFKNKKTIFVKRDHRPLFDIEEYTDKLLVREMSDTHVLLEFYLNKYPTENKRSRFMVSEMKKIVNGKHRSPVLDFEKVFFITNKALGCGNNLEFDFKINKFHRVVEYEGHYVLKFVAEKIVYGDNIFEKYRMADLDEKYDKKEKK
jgi:hypothetical protein